MLTFLFLNQTLWCYHSLESSRRDDFNEGHIIGFGWEMRKLSCFVHYFLTVALDRLTVSPYFSKPVTKPVPQTTSHVCLAVSQQPTLPPRHLRTARPMTEPCRPVPWWPLSGRRGQCRWPWWWATPTPCGSCRQRTSTMPTWGRTSTLNRYTEIQPHITIQYSL